MYEFKLPDLGEGVHEGQIVNVMVQEGQSIGENEPLMEVETDKAAVEIPSPVAGTIKKVNVTAGQTVHVGDVMVVIDDGAAGAEQPPAEQQAAAEPARKQPAARTERRSDEDRARTGRAVEQRVQDQERQSAAASGTATAAPPRPPRAQPSAPAAPSPAPQRREGPIPAAPVVRKLARELNVDLALVPPSGPNGRVLREDVERYAEGGGAVREGGAQAAAGPLVMPGAEALPDFEQYGPVRREKPPQIRKTIARQMTRAWLNVPRVTHCDTADVTELETNRKSLNKRLREDQPKMTMTAIVLKAVAAALREYPMLNCSYDAQREEVVYKEYIHLGVAVDTPRGLVVPVIRDVDRKTLPQIAAELHGVGDRAREAKFEIAELRGATFTITNVGALGGSFVTPMVNFPEVGILGLGRAAWQPKVMPDMSIAPRMLLPLSLSFDHRICDGADAARFTRDVIESLENPLRLISFA